MAAMSMLAGPVSGFALIDVARNNAGRFLPAIYLIFVGPCGGVFFTSRGVPHLPRRAKSALWQMLPLRQGAGLPAARSSLAKHS